MTSARAIAKRILPEPLARVARDALTYQARVGTWLAIMKELHGATAADQKILRQSFRRGLVSALKNLRDWQNPQLVENATIVVPGVAQFRVRAFSDDLYQLLPSQEAKVHALIRERLTPGSTFVDAGANIGVYTALASRLVGPAGRIFSIEMMPETAAVLRAHIDANGLTNVHIFEAALSDKKGEQVTAFVPQLEYGQASIVRRGGEHGRTVSVASDTLDNLLSDVGSIDLIKIDIEGAEATALTGGRKILSRTTAVIFEQLEGEALAADVLRAAGFEISRLDPRNWLAVRR